MLFWGEEILRPLMGRQLSPSREDDGELGWRPADEAPEEEHVFGLPAG